jgi:uncharacterized membrane protein (DUF106 family)
MSWFQTAIDPVPPSASAWVPLATAFAAVGVALAAVIIGPIVSLVVARRQNENSLKIARQQNDTSLEIAKQQNETAVRTARQHIRADVISTSRHRWMDTFRDAMAEYLSTVVTWAFLYRGTPTDEEAKESVARVTLYTSKIAMLLNWGDDEHKALMKAMNKFLSAVGEGAGDPKAITPFRHEITTLAANILKHEGERTKTELDEW